MEVSGNTHSPINISGLSEKEKRTLLTQLIAKENSEHIYIPLSFSQQRLWFLDQLESGSPAYNIPTAYRLTGSLNVTALEQSFSEIFCRHETLRTIFPAVDGQPSQKIAPHQAFALSIIDLGENPETEREAIAQQIATQQAQQPFNLATEPLFRVKLLRLTGAEHMLLLNMHHIVSDGWSFDVFFRELTALYTAFSTDKPSPLPELPIQYADFAHWQREWLQGEVLESQLNYWKQQLGGSLPILQLPTDYPRPPVQTYQGAYQSQELSLNLTKALKALSQQERVTLFMTLLSAFQTLLYRYSGQEDIIVGTPIAGRNQVETEGLIGLFVNTLAIRTNLSGNPSFRQLLNQVREVTLGAYDHQDLPLEKLIEELNPERDLSRSPLFQVMFVFQNTPSQPWKLPGLTITPLEVHSGTSKFDLTLALKETSEGIKGEIDYNTDLFKAETITRMLGHFQTLLESIVANPEQRLWDLPFLTAAEQHQLLVEFNQTQKDYPTDKCVHQLFEEQADRAPDTIAVIFENQTITYRELNDRANQLAHHLQKQGVEPESIVGICAHRSLEIIVGMLGILKVGAAYLPIDPATPADRKALMLEDARVQVLITQQRLAESLPKTQVNIVCIDTDIPTTSASYTPHASSDNLAYVIYTSGSTGTPKGVAIEHRQLLNYLYAIEERLNLPSGASFATVSTFATDLGNTAIFPALCSGGCLHIVSQDRATDPEALAQYFRHHSIDCLKIVPSHLAALLTSSVAESILPRRRLILGGEAASWELIEKIRKINPDCLIFNHYGPTEATVGVLTYQVYGEELKGISETVPLGRPIANTQIYLLDRNLQPVPIGIPGEIYVGGNGLARSYLNRPNLTEEKFIPNSFLNSKFKIQNLKDDRLYKTGDLARYLPDGNIEFLGRIDNQVKIRGFRIELGEVESTLSQYPAVQQCAVIARIDTDSDKRLVAYIVADQQQKPTTDELRRFLKQKLPDYMVPSAFVFPDALPLTPNGKIDRRALPAPDRLKLEPASTFVPPSDDLEIQLTKIWENVLGKKPIGVKDNFFDLGGHSLLAVRLFAQIEKIFGKNLPLATLFLAPNIEELANILRQKGWSAPWQTLVAIQPGGSKPPLFCIHPVGGNVLCYRDLAHYLGQEQPVYGLQAVGLDGKQAPYKRVEDMAAHYIREIRAFQPEGPYLLAGHSAAGMVAFEIAQQLVAGGQKVAVLALLDAYSPQSFVRKLPPGRTLYINFLNLLRLRPEDKLPYIKQRAVWLHGRITRKIAKTFNLWMRRLSTEDSHPYALITEAFSQAIRDYVPQVYPGQATLFRTRHQPTGVYYDPLFGWGSLVAGGLKIRDVPGLHLTLLTEPCVQVLGENLRACIDEALEDVSEDHSSEPNKSTTELEYQTNFLNQERLLTLQSSLVPIQPHGLKPPLFCVHVLGRGLKFYLPLAHHFALEQSLYGLAAQILDKKYAPPNRVKDLAAHYIKEMRVLQPDGPYFLVGVSFGGLVAFEIAQQLVAQGQQVALLALLDTYAPGAVKQLVARQRISAHWNNFLQLGPTYILEKSIENVKGKNQRFNHQLNHTLKKICCKFYRSIGQPLPDNLQDFTFQQENQEAASNYVPQAYPGRVTLFRCMDEITGISSYRDPLLGWGELAVGGLEIHEVPSTHLGMLQEPHVQVLAEKLRACIDRVQVEDLAHIPPLRSDPFEGDNNEDAEG